jgi:GH25 family lysozyme M1 (1,4-beta-N-acetylmuramidase)
MADNAPGIDVSSYQSVLTRADLDGLSFVFTKASDGTTTDPNFAANWAVLKSAGMHRGAYHELQGGSAGPQADHFLSVVKAAGLEAGDMLAVAASDYSGVTDAEVKAWCDQVQAAAHLSPVLVYSDLSTAATLTSCTKYDLWVAWPNPENQPPAGSQLGPWKTWRFWQWDETTLDRDIFNGTSQQMSSWIDSVANPAGWTFGPPQNLKATGGTASVKLTWAAPADEPETPAEYNVFIYNGTATNTKTIVDSYPRIVKTTEFEGGSLERGRTYTAHVVAEGPNGTRVGRDTYASVTFKTG